MTHSTGSLFQALHILENHGPDEHYRAAIKKTPVEDQCRELTSTEMGHWIASRASDVVIRRAVYPFLEVIGDASLADAQVALSSLRHTFEEVKRFVERVALGCRDCSLIASFEASIRVQLVSSFRTKQDFIPHNSVPISAVLDEFDGPDPTMYGNHSATAAEQQPLLRFLQRYGFDLLDTLEEPNGNLVSSRDPTLCDLHAIGIPQLSILRSLWIRVAADAVAAKVQTMGQDLFVPALEMLLDWKQRVIDRFVAVAICTPNSNSDRSFESEWSARFSDELLTKLGRRRIASFFDAVVDFPDSAPAFSDLARCLRRVPSLHANLVREARQMLAARLHHAGARTEDILAILVNAIRALTMLYARGEAGAAVTEICGATLEHLRKRRDAVTVLVKEMMAPPGTGAVQILLQNIGDVGDDTEDVTPARASGTGQVGLAAHADVLRVLLGALSLPAVVREYRNSLASSLLDLSQPEGAIDSCSEVLERMKCLFGEDALSQCAVMLRDLDTSKRVGAWIADYWERTQSRPAPVGTRLIILSRTCWPSNIIKPAEESFEPHPTLVAMMNASTAAFRVMKPSQNLKYYLSRCSASLSFTQKSRQWNRQIDTTESVPLSLATLVLHLHDANPNEAERGASLAVRTLAELMKTTVGFVEATILPFVPRLLTLAPQGDNIATAMVSIQPYVVSGEAHFEEADQQPDNREPPSFIAPEELTMFATMCQSMLKTGGPKAAAQIENSLRMFGQFRGSSSQAKELLLYLATQGKIFTSDGGATFSMPKPK